MTNTITRQRAIQMIQSETKMFHVVFVKRSDGTIRKMTCRNNVTSRLAGGEASYDANEKGLLTVFDMNAPERVKKGETPTGKRGGYRSIPKETILKVKIGGVLYEVK